MVAEASSAKASGASGTPLELPRTASGHIVEADDVKMANVLGQFSSGASVSAESVASDASDGAGGGGGEAAAGGGGAALSGVPHENPLLPSVKTRSVKFSCESSEGSDSVPSLKMTKWKSGSVEVDNEELSPQGGARRARDTAQIARRARGVRAACALSRPERAPSAPRVRPACPDLAL